MDLAAKQSKENHSDDEGDPCVRRPLERAADRQSTSTSPSFTRRPPFSQQRRKSASPSPAPFLRNAKLILLDEPTSSLDSESERQVAEAITRLCVGRTTMVIAHRLCTIVHADCIHVVENGTIVETGRHDDLLRRCGRYAGLYHSQFKYWTLEAARNEDDQIRQSAGT
jgi:hypothetical protein